MFRYRESMQCKTLCSIFVLCYSVVHSNSGPNCISKVNHTRPQQENIAIEFSPTLFPTTIR